MPASVAILTAIIGGAIAQLLMKTGLQEVTVNNLDAVIFSLITQPFSTLLILIGIGIYVLSMVVWVYALKNHKVSKAYPLLSLAYVVVYALAAFWPGIEESYTMQKSIGIGLIVFGAWYSQGPLSSDEA